MDVLNMLPINKIPVLLSVFISEGPPAPGGRSSVFLEQKTLKKPAKLLKLSKGAVLAKS